MRLIKVICNWFNCMKYLVFLIILICCSCTVNFKDSDKTYSLQNTWMSETMQDGCQDLLIIKNDGNRYIAGRACYLFDDSFGADVEAGGFIFKDGNIKFIPEYSSCSRPLVKSESTIYINEGLFLDEEKYNPVDNTNIFFGCIIDNNFISTNVLFPYLKD